jgi:hypothetical protein
LLPGKAVKPCCASRMEHQLIIRWHSGAGSCLFIDLDFKFDLLRLWQVLRSRLTPRLGSGGSGLRG